MDCDDPLNAMTLYLLKDTPLHAQPDEGGVKLPCPRLIPLELDTVPVAEGYIKYQLNANEKIIHLVCRIRKMYV